MIAANPTSVVKFRSGKWLVVSLFVLAGIVAAGFYYSAKQKIDPAPASAVWGKPSRALRVIVVDMHARTPLTQEIISQVDVIFVRGMVGRDVDSLAKTLGMSQAPRPEIYYPGQNLDPNELEGNAIFSRLPLYEGRSIPNKGGSFGVWAVAVVDGQKFVLSSVSLSENAAKESAMLERAWHELGEPPMIGGGDWKLPSGRNVMVWGFSAVPAPEPIDSKDPASGIVECR